MVGARRASRVPFPTFVSSPSTMMRTSESGHQCGSTAFLRRRHRQSWYLHVDRAQMGAAGEVQGFPVVAAEGNIGGRGIAVHDAAELLALRIEEPDTAGRAALDV